MSNTARKQHDDVDGDDKVAAEKWHIARHNEKRAAEGLPPVDREGYWKAMAAENTAEKRAERAERARLDRISEAVRNVRRYAKDSGETDTALRKVADNFISGIQFLLTAIDMSDPHLAIDDQTYGYVVKSMVRGFAFSAQNGMRWTQEKLDQQIDQLKMLRRQNSESEVTAERIERVSGFIRQLRNQIMLWTIMRDSAAAVYFDEFGEQLQLASTNGKKAVTAANAMADELLAELAGEAEARAAKPKVPEPTAPTERGMFDETETGAAMNREDIDDRRADLDD